MSALQSVTNTLTSCWQSERLSTVRDVVNNGCKRFNGFTDNQKIAVVALAALSYSLILATPWAPLALVGGCVAGIALARYKPHLVNELQNKWNNMELHGRIVFVAAGVMIATSALLTPPLPIVVAIGIGVGIGVSLGKRQENTGEELGHVLGNSE